MTILRRLCPLLLAAVALFCSAARAHEFSMDAVVNAFVRVEGDRVHLVVRAPLFLFKAAKFPVKGAEIDVAGAGAAMQRALDRLHESVQVSADGERLKAVAAAGRLSLPSDRSFESYDRALAHLAAPVASDAGIYVDQGYVDAHFTYALISSASVLSVRSTVASELGDYVKLAIRYIGSGEARSMVITSRSGEVELNPTALSTARGFVGFGVSHILGGYDHLLFLLCLLIPLRGLRQVIVIVTAFTLAHSVTLIGSAFDLAPRGPWFPPFVETVIALSIVYLAVENILGVDMRRRLLLTVLFGLVHGFGFSYGLRQELQFAGPHLLVSLFAFNVGIEAGQIAVLALMLPALALVSKYVLPGRAGVIILCALVAHVAWHWMAERWDALAQSPWPVLDAAGSSVALFWAGGLVLVLGIVLAVARRVPLDAWLREHSAAEIASARVSSQTERG